MENADASVLFTEEYKVSNQNDINSKNITV